MPRHAPWILPMSFTPLLGQRAGEEEEILPAIAFNEAVALASRGWWPLMECCWLLKWQKRPWLVICVEILLKIKKKLVTQLGMTKKALEWKKMLRSLSRQRLSHGDVSVWAIILPEGGMSISDDNHLWCCRTLDTRDMYGELQFHAIPITINLVHAEPQN